MTSARYSPMPAVRALSVHARYACAHSGQCCRAGWPIPVEPHVLPVLRRALDDATLEPVRPGVVLHVEQDGPPSVAAVLGRDGTGACVFFDERQRDRRCRIHRRAGTQALPITCRQFPRVARHDARGVDVSLSHWCPTALAALATHEPMAIVDAPPAFRDAAGYEGLDARGTWPPLLRPDCLFDFAAYEVLEHRTIALLARSDVSPWTSLGQIGCWWEALRAWRPDAGPLLHAVTRLAPLAPSMQSIAWNRPRVRASMREALRAATPAGLREPRTDAGDASAIDDIWSGDLEVRRLAGRHLAARFFGSWLAYQGNGLRAQLAGLLMALVALEDGMAAAPDVAPRERTLAAIRRADLALVHLAVPEVVAREACRLDAIEPRHWPHAVVSRA